ncbi:MAG: DUF3999 family protein, partial [Patescibacteria group bacterium]
MKITNMKKLLLIGALFMATTALADFSKTDWEFKSAIEPGVRQVTGYVSFDIPSEAFQNLNQNLSDLRIVSGETEVPFVLAREGEKDYLSDIPATIFNISSVQGASTSFIVDIGKSGTFHNRVTIETSSENFKRDVKVEGSDDQKNWGVLNQDGQIFDYTYREGGYINSKWMSVEYPQSTFRYLHVTIFDRGEVPLKIIGGNIQSRQKSPAKEVSYPSTFEQNTNSGEKATDLIVDIGVSGAPHSHGELITGATNFSRAIVVSESADKMSWKVLGNGYIFSISTPEFTGKNLSFSYPESRKRYLKISILNHDDQPITISGANIFGVIRKVLFKFETGKEYSVYLGNPKAKAGEYDLSTVSQYLRAENVGSVTMEQPIKNSNFIPTLPPLSE